MNKNTTCPVWGTTPASVMERAPSVSLVDSARAGGEYWIDTKARDYLGGIDDQRVRARLTSWLVERRRLGEMRPHEVWENAIKPGIEDAGYEAIRIDRKEHLNRIDDEIIAELRRARFVVADFTHGDDGPRGGVYYEAGFAYGLSIPVIFSCRSSAIG